jgi:sterol desaturase/sphingolipid hydroxylase (fatty acid hydroxylase superfamily)
MERHFVRIRLGFPECATISASMQPALESLLAWKSAAVFAWLALFFVAERLLPAAPRPAMAGTSRLMRNGGLLAVNIVVSVLVVGPATALAAAHAAQWRPGWWSGWIGLFLDLVLLDFLIYWWHRFNHEVGFLWRFHEVHHLDRFLDTSSALRFHAGEVLLSATARAAFILVLGFPLASVLVFEALLLMAAIFHHSNLRLPPPFESLLSRLVITPSIHWVHHHRVRRDTDSNYGTVFSFWDRLFRTRSSSPRTPMMEIGVERREELSLPGLLLRPFREPGSLSRSAGP